MNANIYGTVGDRVEFVLHPKGSETYRGNKGNWKTIEGPRVIQDIPVTDAESFKEKYNSIKSLYPDAVVRFH